MDSPTASSLANHQLLPTPIPRRYLRARLSILLLALMTSAVCRSMDGFQDYGQTGQAHPFMESMQIMMDAMGMNNLNSAGAFNSPWSQFSQMPGSDLMSPWGGGSSQMQQMMRNLPQMNSPEKMTQYGQKWMQSPQSMPFMGSQLDGVWQGRSGEILVIRGNQYAIQAGQNRSTQGQLRIRGDQLWLQNPDTKTVKQYEFAAHEGRLVLRDEYGQLLLFRRADN